MLAKVLKIKTLKRQRNFIKKQLSHLEFGKDGHASYRYVGYIYPEVILYFKDEGFTITNVKSDMLTAMAGGHPVYIFAVSDSIKLSDEEMKLAEAYEPEEDGGDEHHDFWETAMRGAVRLL